MCAELAFASVTDVIADRPELSTFNNMLRRSRIVADLDGDGPFTVFAPTNAAFDRLPAGAMGGLVDDQGRLRDVIGYHVVDGLYLVASVIEMEDVPTLAGRPLTLTPTEQGLVAGSAGVVDNDITADNGVVHVVDAVLLPE